MVFTPGNSVWFQVVVHAPHPRRATLETVHYEVCVSKFTHQKMFATDVSFTVYNTHGCIILYRVHFDQKCKGYFTASDFLREGTTTLVITSLLI